MATTMTRERPPAVWRLSIGQKLLMAGSGVILVGFVIAHMIGNLKVYLGSSEINRYGEGLRTLAEPIFPRTMLLWLIRAVLIAAFIVHVSAAIMLGLRSRAARQTRYSHPGRVQADPAASTMRWGGLFLALFVLFHLAHFTWGWIHPGYTYVRGDVYHNMVEGFSVWWISAIYIVAMIALAMHIYHGTWSIFQTFGVNNTRWDRRIRRTATTVALVVAVGNISMPIAVLTNVVS